ncbi:hypothetical protein [Fibrobacter sp. UWB12]|uniref:hypothetical protein n=1 Tax=Fibrobacter sp. UWB12 TaxID=1896203 RepID=UPI00091BBFD3|nr:hypothetical protein [Fibrobacter sp. UWB12]SHK41540.1 hypothetical protein SAMN05720759_102370 [Fibrobacter sp. UWB12]
MKFKSRNIVFSFVATLLLAATGFAASEEKLDHDNSILSVFVQPSISFISFEERKYFQNAIDTIYYGFKENAVNSAESLNVAKQDFQKVNFCFPITAGIQWQFAEDHFLSAGIGFIYDNESVVLTDRKSSTHSYEYTLQGIPLYLEYRFALPKNFITLSTGGLFSLAVRWYWALPGTEIYTTWGKLEAETPLLGAGFGVSVGYLFATWKSFKLYGDIGFNSISVKSNKKFSDIVPNGPNEKAKWNLGGLQLQIRGSFGLWNKPKPKDDDDDDDDDGENAKPKVMIIDDTKKDSTNVIADSAKVDSTIASTSVTDSLKTVQDSVKVTADTAKVADSLGVAADSAKATIDSAKVTAATAKDSVGTAQAKDPVTPATPAEKKAPAVPAEEIKTKGD